MNEHNRESQLCFIKITGGCDSSNLLLAYTAIIKKEGHLTKEN